MKKSLMELTTEEFVRLICDMPEVYTLEIKVYNNDDGEQQKNTTIVGTYEKLQDFLSEYSELKDWVENNLFDYNVDFSELDIYNYLDEKTIGFDVPRVRILLDEIECIHLLTIRDERKGIINEKISNGWKDYKIIEKNIFGKVEKMIDYDDAFNTVFGLGYDFFYYEVLRILKKKLPQHKPQEQRGQLPPELQTERAVKSLAKAVDLGYLKKTETGYEIGSWTKTQLGYYIKKLINPKGTDIIPYKRLEKVFNVKRLDSAVDGAVNAVQRPQKWRTKIDELFK